MSLPITFSSSAGKKQKTVAALDVRDRFKEAALGIAKANRVNKDQSTLSNLTTTSPMVNSPAPKANTPVNVIQKTTEEKIEEVRNSSRLGNSNYANPADSALGKSTEAAISQMMSGQGSSAVQNARTSGLESLGRKAQDIRGQGTEAAINAGMIGQGGAVKNSMMTEQAIGQMLGDFEGQYAGIRSQEAKDAIGLAQTQLGIRGQGDQIGEMKRQSIVKEGQSELQDERGNQVDLLNALSAMKDYSPATAGAILQQVSSGVLGRNLTDEEIQSDRDWQGELTATAELNSKISGMDSSTLRNEFSKDDQGQWLDSSGRVLSGAESEYLSGVMSGLPPAQASDFGSMTPEQVVSNFDTLTSDQKLELPRNAVRTLVANGDVISSEPIVGKESPDEFMEWFDSNNIEEGSLIERSGQIREVTDISNVPYFLKTIDSSGQEHVYKTSLYNR